MGTNMTDHADIVRDGIGGRFFTSGDEEEITTAALAALDRLVAERDEAVQMLADFKATTEDIIEAAEAERDEARRERDKALLSVEGLSKRLTIAVAAEAEVARLNHENGALEEEARALREALVKWESVSPHHRGECLFLTVGAEGCTCGLQAARDMTRAALAAPTKEDTDE